MHKIWENEQKYGKLSQTRKIIREQKLLQREIGNNNDNTVELLARGKMSKQNARSDGTWFLDARSTNGMIIYNKIGPGGIAESGKAPLNARGALAPHIFQSNFLFFSTSILS